MKQRCWVLKNSGVDAVITIVLLDKEKERHYVPGEIYYSPTHLSAEFLGYYSTMYGRIYSLGLLYYQHVVFLESNLYDLGSKELLYSVQTESLTPGSMEGTAHEYGRQIVKDIVKKQVLSNLYRQYRPTISWVI